MKARAFGRGVAVVLVAVTAACGLPDDKRPRLVAAEDAPIDLAPTTAPAETATTGEDTVEVFFLDANNRLRRVLRSVDDVTVSAAVGALLMGLAEDDPPALTSAIPPGTVLVGVSVVDRVLTLDLGPAGEGGLQSVQGPAQLRAFAQLVRTATALPGIASVRFLIEGVPIDAPTDAGATGRPVTRADYASLSPAGG